MSSIVGLDIVTSFKDKAGMICLFILILDLLFDSIFFVLVDDIDSLGNMYNAFFATESVGNAQRSVDEQINYYKQHSKYVKKLDKDDRNYKAGEKEFII